MNQDSRQQVLHYLQSVLGISRVLPQANEIVEATSQTRVSFWLSTEDRSLEIFNKMIQAMQLDEGDYQILTTAEPPPETPFIVVFGESLFNQYNSTPTASGIWANDESTGRKWMWTYTPTELEQKTTLKKRAWQDLQGVMRELKK